MRRAWLVVAAFALCVLMFAQRPPSAQAQVVVCPSGIIVILVQIKIPVCGGGATATPSPSATPSSTPTPSPTPTIFSTPIPFGTNAAETDVAHPPIVLPSGQAIGTVVHMSDQIADGFGLNTQDCQSNSAHSGSPLAVDTLSNAMVRDFFRRVHVRDGLYQCYSEPALETWYTNEFNANALDLQTGMGAYQPQTYLNSLPAYVTALALNVNEMDSAGGSSGGNLTIGPTTVGQQDGIPCFYSGSQTQCTQNLYPGQLYKVLDATSSASNEYITLASVQPDAIINPGNAYRTTMKLTTPLLFAHAAGSVVERWDLGTNAIAADFTSEYFNGFYYTAGNVRASTNGNVQIVAGSLAHPINSSHFATVLGNYAGGYFDATNEHSYPNPDALPQEGTNGDWWQGYGPGHTPCGGNYSWMSDGGCGGNQEAGPRRENLPHYITEYSRDCVPEAGPVNAGAQGNEMTFGVCSDYTIKLFAGMQDHGIARVYYFRDIDGQSGCSSLFYAYGLITNTLCSETAAPHLKPQATALIAFENLMTDPACPVNIDPRRSTCSFTPNVTAGTWSNTALPFNAYIAENSLGYVFVTFYNGGLEYPSSPTSTCDSLPSACVTALPTIAETYTNPLLTSGNLVTEFTWDSNPSDPTPAPRATSWPDGNSGNAYCDVRVLTAIPTTGIFGCPSLATTPTVTSNSVSFNAGGPPQTLIFKVTAPTTTTTAVPTYPPLPQNAAPTPPPPGTT